MTILGGMHTFIGPVVGVAVFLYVQNKFSWIMERWELVVGILFMALILIFPDGIVGTIKIEISGPQDRQAQEVEPELARRTGVERIETMLSGNQKSVQVFRRTEGRRSG